MWNFRETKLLKSTTFCEQINGQSKAINMKVAQLLTIFSITPRTWDEKLPYVQQKYNRESMTLIDVHFQAMHS
jgi:hypothetical protein